MIRKIRVLAAVTIVCFAGGAARADELTDRIPATAKFVLAVENLGKTSANVAAFADAIGVPAPMTLQQLAEQAIPAGVVDWSKPAAAAFMEMSGGSAVLALPTNDVKGAIAKLNGKAKGPLYEVELNSKTSYMLTRGNYLFVGDSEEHVKTFADPQGGVGTAMGASGASRRTGSDVFFFLNMEVVRPIAEEGLTSIEALTAMVPSPPGQEKSTQAQLKSAFGMVRALLKSTERVSGALTLKTAAADVKIDADFKEGSELRKMFGAGGASAADLLSGLPAGEAALAIGMQYGPFADATGKYGLEMAKSMSDKLSDADLKNMEAANKAMTQYLDSMGMTMNFGDRGIAMLGVMNTKKPGELFAAMKQNAVSYSKMNQALGEFKQEEKTVDGKSVFEVTASFDKMPDEAKAAVEKMYPKGLRTQYVEIPGAVAMGMNVDPNIVAAMNAGKPPYASQAKVKSVLDALPTKSQLVMTIDPFGFMRMAQKMAENQIPLPELPAESPAPFGLALSSAAGGATFQIHVRTDTVKALAKLGQGGH